MYKAVKITAAAKELQKMRGDFDTKQKQISDNLFYVCRNIPVQEGTIIEQLGIARSTWVKYKRTVLPFDVILRLVDVLKGITIDNKPVIV